MLAFILPFTKPVFGDLATEKKEKSEELLVLGLRNSDPSAIKKAYTMYSSALYGIIKRILKSDEIAEDILQDTFVKIWKSITLYDSSKGRLFTWMANVAKNLAIDHLRSKAAINSTKTDDILEIASACIDPKSHVNFNIDAIGVKNLINLLKSDQRIIVDLIYFQGYTHVQAAEILNIPLGTIKTKLRSSILYLRKQFNECKISA